MGRSGQYSRLENVDLPLAIAPTKTRLERILKIAAPSFDIMSSALHSRFIADYILHPWILYAFVSSNISFQHVDDPAAGEAFEMLKKDVIVSQICPIFKPSTDL